MTFVREKCTYCRCYATSSITFISDVDRDDPMLVCASCYVEQYRVWQRRVQREPDLEMQVTNA